MTAPEDVTTLGANPADTQPGPPDNPHLPEATAWHVAAWTCETCGAVSLIMDPAGDGPYDCDDCGEPTHINGVDG